MLDLERVLVVHGVDTARWARRHGVEPFTAVCDACGAAKTTTIPIAMGSLRGLVAPRCVCGDPSDTYCVIGIFDQQERLDR